MKSKVAVMTVLVLGLQSAAFAAPRKGPIRPYPNPTLPQPTVVVSVIDNAKNATTAWLSAVIDNTKERGRRQEAPQPRPGLRARKIIGARQYVLPDFSVKLPPLATASLRGPRTLASRVSLAVTSMQSLAQSDRRDVPVLREVDLALTAVVTQQKGQHGVTARVFANRQTTRFGELSATVTPELRRRLPVGPTYAQMFVDIVRVVLDKSLPKVRWAVR